MTDPVPVHPRHRRTATPADRLAGLLLGTAVGDALGLPVEGLSRRGLGSSSGHL